MDLASYPTVTATDGAATPHPLIYCAPLVSSLPSAGPSSSAARRVGRQMVAALIQRGYFFADADAVLPLALMSRAYAETTAAHDTIPEDVKAREQQIGGSGGSLEPPGPLFEPPGPLLTHLHTVYMACSDF